MSPDHRSKLLLPIFGLYLLASLVSCNLSTDARKRANLEKGNKLFAAGKFSEAELTYRKAIQLDPKYGEAYYRLALTSLELGDPGKAYEGMSNAVGLLPNRDDIKAKFADICLLLYLSNAQRPPKLYNHLTNLADGFLRKSPASYEGLRIRGYMLQADKNIAESTEFFRKANAVKPYQPEIVLALAKNLIRLNEYDEAEKLGLSLIEKNKSFGPIYDVLFNLYEVKARPAQAEAILRAKADNNPKVAAYITRLAAYYVQTGDREKMSETLQRLLKAPDQFPQAHLLLGDFYAGLGDLLEARAQLEEGARRHPDEASIYQKRLANLLLLQGKKSEAVELVDKMLTANPADEGSRSMKASLQLESGQAEKIAAAVAEFAELVKKSPENTTARYNLGRALMVQGNFESSRNQFVELLRQRPDFLAARFHLAEIGIQTLDYSNAIRYAGEIVAVERNDVKARILLARGHTGLGRFKEARKDLADLLAAHPPVLDAQLQMGIIAAGEKKFTEAEAIFRQCYKPGHSDLRPLEGLVDSLIAQREFDGALQLLADELKKSPDSVPVRSLLAASAAKCGKFDKAIEQYEQLTAKMPTIVDFQVRLGEVWYQSGDLNRAVTSIRKARAMAPRLASVSTYLASLLEASGKRSEAIATYRESLNLEPNNPVAMNNLAYLLADSKENLEEAGKLAEKAQKLMSSSPIINDTLGWIYLKRGQIESALPIFRNLSRSYPSNPTFHYHYGLSLWQVGDRKKAKEELQLALSNRPSELEQLRIKELISSAK